jgi:hypothetical protein
MNGKEVYIRMCKKASVPYFKVLYNYLLEETVENQDDHRHGSCYKADIRTRYPQETNIEG